MSPKATLLSLITLIFLGLLLIFSCSQPDHHTNQWNAVQTLSKDQVVVFFSKNRGNQVVTEGVIRNVPPQLQNEALEVAVTELLRGPTDEESAQGFFSEIPKGTRLLGINKGEKVITVNLSQQFTSGGGSNSMEGRLNELTQTIRSAEKNKPVYVDIEGQRLTVLGGEGVPVDEPINQSQGTSPQ